MLIVCEDLTAKVAEDKDLTAKVAKDEDLTAVVGENKDWTTKVGEDKELIAKVAEDKDLMLRWQRTRIDYQVCVQLVLLWESHRWFSHQVQLPCLNYIFVLDLFASNVTKM